jgi:FkbM family methyltransferase
VLQRVVTALNRLPIGRVPVGVRRVRLGGDRLYADTLDRWLAALAWSHGLLERPERALIAREVRPGMVSVDVGANIGFHTLLLARAVGPRGVVHALEPDPRNFALLVRAVEGARLRHVRLHQVAAADRGGEMTLHVSTANRGDHRLFGSTRGRQLVPVSVITLDELLAEEGRIDFLKIDAQGAEANVLRGLRATLARNPDARVLCELCAPLLREAGADPADVFGPLGAGGRRPHLVSRDGSYHPVSEDAAWGRALAAGLFGHSFYFVRT